MLNDIPDRGHKQISNGNGEVAECGFQNGKVAAKVITHGLRHLLCRTGSCIHDGLQAFKGYAHGSEHITVAHTVISCTDQSFRESLCVSS